MDRDSALVAVGVGAAITVAFSFVPFSSVLGGIAAASRRNDGYLWGLGIGTAAGVAAALPLGILFAAAFAVVAFLGFGVPPSSPAYDLYLTIVALLFLLYTVGLSALGGVVGVWIRANTTWDLDPLERI
ncbi:DUF5518 domain-containing protein [Halobacteria archaeon HArc-gm2]|nr:DUF5518 domain-containing protein [Halobacteria archaeon HArc-gm2]